MTLEQYAARANECHDRFKKHVGEALRDAKEAGMALNRAKWKLGHGPWTEWLEQNFKGSPETARNYMRVAKHWKLLQRIIAGNPSLSIDGALRSIRLQAQKGKHQDDDDQSDVWERYVSTARKTLEQRLRRRIVSKWSEEVIVLLGEAWMSGDLDDFLNPIHDEVRPVAKVIVDYRKKFAILQDDDPLKRRLRKEYRATLKALMEDESLTEYQHRVISEELSNLRNKQTYQLSDGATSHSMDAVETAA